MTKKQIIILLIIVALYLLPTILSVKLYFDLREVKQGLRVNNAVTLGLVEYVATGNQQVLQNIINFIKPQYE